MTREKIIQGLQFTIEMCLFDPMTGAQRPKEVLNDLDKTTVDACEGAIKLLEQEPCEDAVSRKQVITEIKKWWRTALDAKGSPLICEIIKNLPPAKSKQEPCNDCISREAAIKSLEDNKYSSEFCVEHHIDLSINLGMAQIALNELPSIQPKQESVIHAKWERGYSFPDGEYWKCLHCNELIKVKIPMHYCNNCGAKMDKE